MSNVEYDTIKIRKPARQQLDSMKRSMGYPSYSQIISALLERQSYKDEIINELKSELVEEASKILIDKLFNILMQLIFEINKPPQDITVKELFTALEKRKNSPDTTS
jgi:predicted CopG family antitoxin